MECEIWVYGQAMNAAYLSVHLLTANIWHLFAERAKPRQAQAQGGNKLLIVAKL